MDQTSYFPPSLVATFLGEFVVIVAVVVVVVVVVAVVVVVVSAFRRMVSSLSAVMACPLRS